MERRQTIQKELVLNAVRTLKKHATADEVYSFIANEHPSVGKGTVYRNLNILADEGKVRKVEISDGPDRFDFTLTEHYHVKCIKCGDVSDVDMVKLSDLKKKIKDDHGIEFLGYDILFRGICPKCKENNIN